MDMGQGFLNLDTLFYQPLAVRGMCCVCLVAWGLSCYAAGGRSTDRVRARVR